MNIQEVTNDLNEDSAIQTNVMSTIGLSMDYDRLNGSPLTQMHHVRGQSEDTINNNNN